MFLQEIKLMARRMERLKFRLGFDCCLAIDSEGCSGGLTLMWKNDVLLTVKSFSKHYIDTRVREIEWQLTGIYGHPETAKKN